MLKPPPTSKKFPISSHCTNNVSFLFALLLSSLATKLGSQIQIAALSGVCVCNTWHH